MDKSSIPFIGCRIDAVGLFPWDEDGNWYLLVSVELFSKWVDTHTVLLLHSWRAAEFLYNDVFAHWSKPYYAWIDNDGKFVGSFSWICKELGIIHYQITVGNSKANGQVERIIWMLKDYI